MSNRSAPYQVALHDGRLIFAPSDEDAVIRLRGPAAEGGKLHYYYLLLLFLHDFFVFICVF